MFLIVIATILAVIIGLTLICVGFLFNKSARSKLRLAIAAIDLILIAICIIGMSNRDLFSNAVIEILGSIMTVVFASQIICVVLVLAALIIRSIYRLFNKPAPFSRERRSMLAYALFYPIYSFATATYANQVERNDTVDNFYDIKIKNLPEELEGFKIAQISDIHLGAFYSLERLENMLNRIVEAKPYLLAITGDIFDSVEINDEAIKLVDSFCDKFKYGIYYCHGNHEHHRGIKAIEEGLTNTKIHWLVNSALSTTHSELETSLSTEVAEDDETTNQNNSNNSAFRIPNSALYIIGVDYPMGAPVMQSKDDHEQSNFNKLKHDYLSQAMKNVPKDAICILLAHHPEFIDDAVEYNIHLTLTGHTHGSQIGIFGMPLFPVFKYTRGMFEHTGNDGETNCYGYVHVGNGSWFPFRLGCPPEIAYFTLIKN